MTPVPGGVYEWHSRHSHANNRVVPCLKTGAIEYDQAKDTLIRVCSFLTRAPSLKALETIADLFEPPIILTQSTCLLLVSHPFA